MTSVLNVCTHPPLRCFIAKDNKEMKEERSNISLTFSSWRAKESLRSQFACETFRLFFFFFGPIFYLFFDLQHFVDGRGRP